MNLALKIRLCAVMFLQFFIIGAFTPLFSLYLKDSLRFTGTEVGIVLSVTSAGAIFAPLVAAFITDRWISAERLLALLQLAGGGLLLLFARQTEFYPVLMTYLLFTIFNGPTFALTNAIIFHHSPDSRHKFGTVRVWGTIGWIAAAWVIGILWLHKGGDSASDRIPETLHLAAYISIALGLYCFTLPTRKSATASLARGFLPVEAFKVLLSPPVLRLCLFMMGMSFFYRYYYFGTGPFLRSIGISDTGIMPLMSLGQITEVVAMSILGGLLLRWGPKRIIALGLAIEIFRYCTACIGGPFALVTAGLVVHGLAYTFVYTTASIYLDGHCDERSRSGVHQLFAMLTSGIATFAGSIVCGVVMDLCTSDGGTVNYHWFWAAPIAGFGCLFIATVFGNKNHLTRDTTPQPSGPEIPPFDPAIDR